MLRAWAQRRGDSAAARRKDGGATGVGTARRKDGGAAGMGTAEGDDAAGVGTARRQDGDAVDVGAVEGGGGVDGNGRRGRRFFFFKKIEIGRPI